MKKVFIISLFLLFVLHNVINAQTNTFPSSGAAGIGTTAPNTSSLLEIRSTTKGFLMPRMTLAQRNAIASPVKGLEIYQTDNTPGFYYYSGTAWKAVTPAATGWLLTGNAGTDSSLNFLGTKDAHPLVFRVNNTKAGYLDYSSTALNTAFGFKAMLVNTTGTANTSVGYTSLSANTTGSDNAAFGVDALYSNTTGNLNTALGTFALTYNTTGNGNVGVGLNALVYNNNGSNNTATGTNALYYNASGSNNTANGYEALFSTTSASNTTAIGAFALYSNTTGDGNTATGTSTLYSNTTGNYNTATGLSALYKNNNGSNNTATGWSALSSNTSGSYNTATGMFSLQNSNGSFNTATGYNTLGSNISGSYNTAGGYAALVANTTSNNTAYGYFALASTTSGDGNTAVGMQAAAQGGGAGFQNSAFGYQSLYNNSSNYNTGIGTQSLFNNVSGASNVAIGSFAGYSRDGLIRCTFAGYGADAALNSLTNASAIGANAVVNASNKIRLGDGSITVVESNAGSWTTSDGRFKNNIKANVKGLEFIKLLRPVTYNFDTKKFQEFLLQNYPDSIKTKRLAAMNGDAMAKSSAILQTGFIAQEVAAAVKKSGYDFNGVHAPENTADNWSLSYEKLVVPLVKAVQELSAKNDDLQKQIDDLKAMVLAGSTNATSLKTSSTIALTGTGLDQNNPNPFSGSTTISYSLPQKFTAAQIIITDKSGKTLKQINVSGSGRGSLSVDAATLSAGAYNYSLLVDGKLISTRQMMLAK